MILITGALGYRKFKPMQQLAELLSHSFMVINYDRRGRGDSNDVQPFALEREIEDVAALIEAEDGPASLWGWSSRGALALRAAAAGIPSSGSRYTKCRSSSIRPPRIRLGTTASD